MKTFPIFKSYLGEDTKVKYPRTPHLPWSLGRSEDDIGVEDMTQFDGKKVVVTEKMDGENTTMSAQYIHARSLDSQDHPSRSWVKGLHGSIKQDIPPGWRICGENLYAQHSISYTSISTYFLVFSIWNEHNVCLSWDDTVEWAELLGLKTVPTIYVGTWDEEKIRGLEKKMNLQTQEGYVVRLYESFPYINFKKSIAKFVRKSHVQTDQHWMAKPVVPNKLAT